MDRKTPPSFKKSLVFNLPSPEKISSSGENEIWYISAPVGEAIKVEVIFAAGRYYEPIPGVAQFTTHLLDKGVPGKDSNEIANELDYYGAHLELKTGYDFSSVSLYTLKKHLDKLLPLLYSITKNPLFPEKELIVYRKIFLENLKVNLEKNDFIASNHIRELIYGNHPYGKGIQSQDVERIETPILKSYFNQHFTPFKIFIVGRIKDDDLNSISKNFKHLPNTNSGSILPIEESESSKRIFNGPNKIQASIRLGKKTIDRHHANWPAMQLLNHILGGYFGSRLMTNIREEKGLTYNIYSSLQNLHHSTTLIVSAEVNSNKKEQALEEIGKEIDQLKNLKEDEVEVAKNHMIGSIQNDITTVFAAAEKIKAISLANLPSNYYQNLITNLGDLTIENLTSIGQSLYRQDDFSSVLVN